MLVIFAAYLAAAQMAEGQTVAYGQTEFVSDVPALAPNFNPSLQNPWGMAFQPGQAFLLADERTEGVTAFDATGLNAGLGGFPVPAHVTAIVAVSPNQFQVPGFNLQFLVTSKEGKVFAWGPDVRGDIPVTAFLEVDNSATGAVYTGAVVMVPNPTCCNPFLAVANFHDGHIEELNGVFAPLSGPGTFSDPNLPAGYAPYGMQIVGNQVFVTYAVQNATKTDFVEGQGNGIVNVFDKEGNFVKRFATGGPLDAPWGVAQAPANFGPFSNDILIGNAGNGIINAFDPNTGKFVGTLKDGNGNAIVDLTLHGMTFRTDGFGDPNTLYLAVGLGNGLDGLFAGVRAGLVTTTQITSQHGANGSTIFTANVTPGPGNIGIPTGSVSFTLDGNIPPTKVALTGETASFTATPVGQGEHIVRAIYSGDATFLTSRSSLEVQVAAIPTTTTINAPANAAAGEMVTLQASVRGQGGTPTGQVAFQDGATTLGTVNLDASGKVSFSTTTLAAGAHTITASYLGDNIFGASASTSATVTIAAADFALGATPSNATVTAGQSTQFMVTITPAGGFSGQVTFACSQVTGILCTFNPATVTPNHGAASTTLTVSTSANVPRYGAVMGTGGGPGLLMVSVALFVMIGLSARKYPGARKPLLACAVALAFAAISVTLQGCGGYSNGTQANRGTAMIQVTAHSGTITQATSVSVTVQ
jgi:uncharacterized protein (TIGR03118 family)